MKGEKKSANNHRLVGIGCTSFYWLKSICRMCSDGQLISSIQKRAFNDDDLEFSNKFTRLQFAMRNSFMHWPKVLLNFSWYTNFEFKKICRYPSFIAIIAFIAFIAFITGSHIWITNYTSFQWMVFREKKRYNNLTNISWFHWNALTNSKCNRFAMFFFVLLKSCKNYAFKWGAFNFRGEIYNILLK